MKKTEKVLVMQIMGTSVLVLRRVSLGNFEVVRVGLNFTGTAHEGDLVSFIDMELPVPPKLKGKS